MYNRIRTMFRDNPEKYIMAIIAIPILAGIIALIIWYIRARCETLQIENGRVVYKRGVLSRDHVELFVANVRSVRIDQSFFQRLFGVGDIFITSSGSTPEIVARGMPDARRARELLVAGGPAII